MALRKVCGIETEYGIIQRGTTESNPIASSSVLINAYLSSLSDAPRSDPVGWDFEDETPGNDARGSIIEGVLAPEIETHLVNAVLTNGARFYVDHAHPEMSTPECTDALDVVVWDRAGEVILQRAMHAARALLPAGQEIVVYKNNSDGKGNSYGCHENYLMDRTVPFGRIVTHVTPHFVTRQLYTGAGKVGTEVGGRRAEVPFQLTQRADFFEEEVGLETTLKRPIVNTRDEPHADAQKYRRLHVIVGDANLSELSTFLKVGTTMLMLCMIEDDALSRTFDLMSPVWALRQVSADLTLSQPLELSDGSTITALEIQWELYDQARKWADENGTEAVGERSGALILGRWEEVLSALEHDPMSLHDRLDWVAKYRLLSAYRERHGLDWTDSRLAAMDLQYHDLRAESSLAARLPLERLVGDEEVLDATEQPPTDTRAWFRGRCLQRWAGEIVAANWDSLVFDVGAEPLRRVPMMEPLRGGKAQVGDLVDRAGSARELLDLLGS